MEYNYLAFPRAKLQTLLEIVRSRDISFPISLKQWFSTFFSSRHTKVKKKIGGALIPKKTS
jgi:hypothetical protein